MGESSHFLSSFFKVFTKTAGDVKSKISTRKGKRAKYPAFPDEIQSRQFSLAAIKAATNNLHENLIIGKGGFGIVYKGFFNHGNLVVAVKRLDSSLSEGFNEFQTEALLLSQLRHQHLESLLGYCCEEGEMILVYEYISNSSLCDHLFGTNNDSLSWRKRLQICIGVARGLHYLHTGAKQTIIHRDINSSNILLDHNWDSKLSYFGLSKLCSRSESKALKKIKSEVKGTRGYVDPEYFRTSELTEKSDVFSFGVVLFEVLCGTRAINGSLMRDEIVLVDLARKCIERGTILKIIDPYLMGKIAPECLRIFVDTAFCCINFEGSRRPDMGEVELMLELALEMQEKADSDHISPHAEYVLQQLSFAAMAAKHPSNGLSYAELINFSHSKDERTITNPI